MNSSEIDQKINLAFSLVKNGNEEKALTILEECRKKCKIEDNTPYHDGGARILKAIGQIYFIKGDRVKAMDAYDYPIQVYISSTDEAFYTEFYNCLFHYGLCDEKIFYSSLAQTFRKELMEENSKMGSSFSPEELRTIVKIGNELFIAKCASGRLGAF